MGDRTLLTGFVRIGAQKFVLEGDSDRLIRVHTSHKAILGVAKPGGGGTIRTEDGLQVSKTAHRAKAEEQAVHGKPPNSQSCSKNMQEDLGRHGG